MPVPRSDQSATSSFVDSALENLGWEVPSDQLIDDLENFSPLSSGWSPSLDNVRSLLDISVNREKTEEMEGANNFGSLGGGNDGQGMNFSGEYILPHQQLAHPQQQNHYQDSHGSTAGTFQPLHGGYQQTDILYDNDASKWGQSFNWAAPSAVCANVNTRFDQPAQHPGVVPIAVHVPLTAVQATAGQHQNPAAGLEGVPRTQNLGAVQVAVKPSCQVAPSSTAISGPPQFQSNPSIDYGETLGEEGGVTNRDWIPLVSGSARKFKILTRPGVQPLTVGTHATEEKNYFLLVRGKDRMAFETNLDQISEKEQKLIKRNGAQAVKYDLNLGAEENKVSNPAYLPSSAFHQMEPCYGVMQMGPKDDVAEEEEFPLSTKPYANQKIVTVEPHVNGKLLENRELWMECDTKGRWEGGRAGDAVRNARNELQQSSIRRTEPRLIFHPRRHMPPTDDIVRFKLYAGEERINLFYYN